MNSTIFALRAKSGFLSPLFALSVACTARISVFDKCFAQNAFFPFIYSNTANFQIKRSCFHNFLDSAITVQATTTVMQERAEYKEKTVISHTAFRRIINSAKNGGAISTTAPISMKNVLFELCNGNNGGSLYAEREVIAEYVTCSNGNAKQSGAFDIRLTDSSSVEMYYSLFKQNSAELFGTMFKTGPGNFNVINSNFTQNRAIQCVGCCEIQQSEANIRNSVFEQNSARVHNGCCVFRQFYQSALESVLFLSNSHKSSEKIAAAAILSYASTPSLIITKSFFIENIYDESYTIANSDGQPTKVSDCCFSGPQDREIASFGVLVDSSNFLIQCDVDKNIINSDIGFLEGRVIKGRIRKMQKVLAKIQKETKPNDKEDMKSTLYLFLLGVDIGVVYMFIKQRLRKNSPLSNDDERIPFI